MRFIVRRTLAAVAVVFAALTMVFLILYWLPGDTAALIAGEDASPETIEHLREALGTDKPLWQQYTSYISGISQGNLGKSSSTGEPVLQRLAAQVPPTLELTLIACLLAIAVGIVIGSIAAINRGKWLDHLLQTYMLFLTSMPMFWQGILLIMVFSVTLRWLPAAGDGSVWHLILPVICIALTISSRLARMVRSSVIDVLDEPFVLALRGKGLNEQRILFYHVLRNALIPVITLFGVLVGELLSSSVVVETLFARRGLGRLLVEAVGDKDIPMVMGVILFVSTIYIFINLLIDISYSWIDPRVQL